VTPGTLSVGFLVFFGVLVDLGTLVESPGALVALGALVDGIGKGGLVGTTLAPAEGLAFVLVGAEVTGAAVMTIVDGPAVGATVLPKQ